MHGIICLLQFSIAVQRRVFALAVVKGGKGLCGRLELPFKFSHKVKELVLNKHVLVSKISFQIFM